jgi:competence protein ComFB
VSESQPEKHDEFVLVNITEHIVRKKVEEMMPQFDMCRCPQCFLDACAVILNRLPPRYATTRKGELLTLVEASRLQFKTDLTVFVLQALKKIKESPRHR